MDKIDGYVASWVTPEGFLSLFYQYCKEYKTYEQAYEAAERLFESSYGKRRYANWESFKEVKNRTLRNR